MLVLDSVLIFYFLAVHTCWKFPLSQLLYFFFSFLFLSWWHISPYPWPRDSSDAQWILPTDCSIQEKLHSYAVSFSLPLIGWKTLLVNLVIVYTKTSALSPKSNQTLGGCGGRGADMVSSSIFTVPSAPDQLLTQKLFIPELTSPAVSYFSHSGCPQLHFCFIHFRNKISSFVIGPQLAHYKHIYFHHIFWPLETDILSIIKWLT